MGLGDVDGEGEGSWKLPWRNREREKEAAGENVPSRRIQNSQPGARVRATQEGVSCLTSRLEPTSIDGRPAEMPSRVCPVAGGAGCLDISRAVPSPSQFNCLGRGYALFLSSLPVIAAHTDKQEEENRKRECRQLCVSSCPKRTLKLPLATLVGNVSSRRWARRGEVAAPLQALVAFSNRFLLRAPAHPSWPGLPWFQPPSPAAAAAGGAWQPAHLKGVWEGPATIQGPVLSRLTLFCRRRALFHFWR